MRLAWRGKVAVLPNPLKQPAGWGMRGWDEWEAWDIGEEWGGYGQTGIGTLPPAAICADLSCPAWFVAYFVTVRAAKFTWCPTAIGIGNPSLLFPAL